MVTTAQYKSIESLAEFIEKYPRFGEAVESLGARIGTDRAVVAGHAAIMASSYNALGTLLVRAGVVPSEVMRGVQTGMEMFIIYDTGVKFEDFAMLVRLLHVDGDELVRRL